MYFVGGINRFSSDSSKVVVLAHRGSPETLKVFGHGISGINPILSLISSAYTLGRVIDVMGFWYPLGWRCQGRRGTKRDCPVVGDSGDIETLNYLGCGCAF